MTDEWERRSRVATIVSFTPAAVCFVLFVYGLWSDPDYRKQRVDIAPDAATISSSR